MTQSRTIAWEKPPSVLRMGLSTPTAVTAKRLIRSSSGTSNCRWLPEAVADRLEVDSHFYDINTSVLGIMALDIATPAGPVPDIISKSEPFGRPNYE